MPTRKWVLGGSFYLACCVLPSHAFSTPSPYNTARYAAALAISVDDTSEPDAEELIRLIRGSAGKDRPRIRPKAIIVLSDTTGVMAKTAIEKSLVQFNGCDERFFNREIALDESNRDDNDDDDDEACENMATKIYPFLRTEEQVADILKHSKEQFLGLVVFTFADPTLRENTTRMCELSGMQYVDLLGPMLDAMTVFFERPSRGFSRPDKPPNSLRALSDSYYRKIEAVEFTLKCDDGRSPHLLEQADVVLLGVSRTGKTPLSVVISQTMGLKVANVPLVVDLSPPKQLTELDPRRVFCLTLSPRELQRIRRNRIRRELSRQKSDDALPAGATRSTYADPDYLQRDLAHARDIAVAYGFTEIDVTGRAVEETASMVSSFLNRRFPAVAE